MNSLSFVIFAIALLGISLVVNGTFNHKYDYSRSLFQDSFGLRPVNISDIKNLKGNIINLQNDGSMIPAWIVSGKWKIFEIPSDNNITNASNTQNLKFNASITMTSLYGTNTPILTNINSMPALQ